MDENKKKKNTFPNSRVSGAALATELQLSDNYLPPQPVLNQSEVAAMIADTFFSLPPSLKSEEEGKGKEREEEEER